MKQIEQHLVLPLQKEIKAEQIENNEYQQLASMHLHPGMFLWVYSVNEGILRKANSDDWENTADLGSAAKKLVIQKGHIYVLAINRPNAAKKALRMLRSQK